MSGYERIVRVIRHVNKNQDGQLDLAALARQAGLNTRQFHQLFSTWAGTTPAEFVSCLKLLHAKSLLRSGDSILFTVPESSLSGPERLHELYVTLVVASPGEAKSGSEGWTISAGFADSPFGDCLIAEGPRGICHLTFVEHGKMQAMTLLMQEWPGAKIARDDALAQSLAVRIFYNRNAEKTATPLRVYVRGSDFQVRVWRALLTVPPGRLISYGALADKVGRPGAARAAGSAVGRNTIACLIPCHRVIRETGVVGEYRWGSIRKRAMLAREYLLVHGGAASSP